MKYLYLDYPFDLECGRSLPELRITYTTYGQLNERRDNVVWVCHALTANADPVAWWPGLIGEGCVIDPDRYFIVCANMLGSCYGTTGPGDVDVTSGKKYGTDFPLITIRDMVRAHELLRQHLEIDSIRLAIGGSMGGQQVLEWAVMQPGLFKRLVVLATNARHSAWGIAFNEAQRMALLADTTLGTDHPEAGRRGLEAARAIGMLSYRHYLTYGATQTDEDDNKLDNFRAASYQRYQGEKLWRRFDPTAYLSLSRGMDSHHLGRGRESEAKALARIQALTLIIGLDTDVLFPVEEQAFLSRHIPRARLEIIHSNFGHDGFLTEATTISRLVEPFLREADPINGDNPRIHPSGLPGRHYALPGTEVF